MTRRDRIVIVVVAVVVVIGAAWLLVISPKRGQASKLQTQIQSAQSTLNSARSQLAQGEEARRAFRDDYATVVRLGEAVPTDDNVPSLIYQIQSAATKAGVDFQGLTLNPSAANGAPNVAAPSSGSTTSSTSSSTSSTSTTTPPATSTTAPSTTASGTSVSTPSLPPGAVTGPAGFPIEPFTFTFQGNFFHLANFFARLQRFVVANSNQLLVSGRLLNLDAISLAPAPQGFPQITASVSATTYLLPASQGLVDGATPAGPATSSGQPASSTTPTSTSTAPAPAVVSAGGGG